jgi:hypothetical protein
MGGRYKPGSRPGEWKKRQDKALKVLQAHQAKLEEMKKQHEQAPGAWTSKPHQLFLIIAGVPSRLICISSAHTCAQIRLDDTT